MATTRLMPLHTGKGRDVGTAISDIIDYMENPEKTDEGRLVTGYGCNSKIADAEFLFAKRQYAQRTGRARGADDVIAYHLRQSFAPGEVTAEEANRIGYELARRFTKGNHAYIVATHIDREHIHNHIIWNSTTLDCTRKFRNLWGSTKAVRRLGDTLCIENRLSIVENPKSHGKSYNKWQGANAKPSHRELLRTALDDALAQNPPDFPALLALLQKAGYEVNEGKVPALRGKNQKRFMRLDTLGDGYSESELRAVLAGQKAHKPRRKTALQPDAKPHPNLLIDLQAKLRDGKGAGYARWAKVFNLKQMAQTLNFLTEHGLLEYADLAEKTVLATEKYNVLTAQIKQAESRMAEIAVLRTHIVNYAKTREIYAAYRKAGYSKKYLAEHEGDILLHKAAKGAFDALGLKKLPTIKTLQAEYAVLLSTKKTAYAAYSSARQEMRELLTAKANVDRLLGYEEKRAEAERTAQR